MQGYTMRGNVEVSKSLQIVLANLVAKINNKDEQTPVSKEEAFDIVEAVIDESRTNVSREIEERVATKEFVENKVTEAKLELKQEIHNAEKRAIFWLLGTGVAIVATMLSGVWTMFNYLPKM